MKRFALFVLLLPLLAFAQDMQPADFLAQVFEAVKGFGGLPWAGKVISICGILVASMKVSMLRDLVWNKLGAAKVLAAPVLAMVGGAMSLWVAGVAPTKAQIMAYFLAGAGAILVKNVLDGVKQLPAIGEAYVKWIEMIERILDAVGLGYKK